MRPIVYFFFFVSRLCLSHVFMAITDSALRCGMHKGDSSEQVGGQRREGAAARRSGLFGRIAHRH